MPEKNAFYIEARDGSVRVALLAGPYASAQEAQAMLQPVAQWAAEQSGDQWAGFYQYDIVTLPEERTNSRLGSVTPEALGLRRGKESSSAELAAALFGSGAASSPSKAVSSHSAARARSKNDSTPPRSVSAS